MNIIFAGDGGLGIAILKTLHESDHVIKIVLTHNFSEEMKKSAEEYGYDILILSDIPGNPTHIDNPYLENMLPKTDIIICAGYKKLIKPFLYNSTKYKCINLHPGPLPNGRGFDTLCWAILKNYTNFGITIHYVDEGINTGGILARKSFKITLDDTIKILIDKTNDLFSELLLTTLKTLPNITQNHPAIPIKQDPDRGVFFSKISPTDGLINWNHMTALEIHNLVRALTKPYSGAFFHTQQNKKISIWKTDLLKLKYYGFPGKVLAKHDKGIIVSAKDRGLLILKASTEKESDIEKIFHNIGENVYDLK